MPVHWPAAIIALLFLAVSLGVPARAQQNRRNSIAAAIVVRAEGPACFSCYKSLNARTKFKAQFERSLRTISLAYYFAIRKIQV